MLKMGFIFCFCFFCFLGLTGAGQESIQYLNLYETTPTPEVIHALSHSDVPIAVSVTGNVLDEVSSSVLKAESWLRLHVLAHFPAIKITTIVVVSSQQGKRPMSRKLSVMDSKLVKPYPARPTPLPEISPSSIHSSIGFSVPANVARKPHPPQYPTTSPPPFNIPGDSPPPFSFPIAPELPPSPPFVPASPPTGFYLPPCNPADDSAPAPQMGVVQKLWCVAKPTVPADTLQEAMDYACGEGGADCQEIMPSGSCFDPDTIVAHASYAFNSYWQKTKRNGGTCNFGGTAMIINADPSFLQCRFVLS
ncbi:hypothetical protein COLO4_11562 [Corchorus olitorius]|uniref:X8 domain-containing protein n=1 Tax=Corchorus olitorius TaxID=93759 RepID=A0A1R3K443_9ROSI|nr:hypothetical protein COLO4_11562 [Corchorus olitorius]